MASKKNDSSKDEEKKVSASSKSSTAGKKAASKKASGKKDAEEKLKSEDLSEELDEETASPDGEAEEDKGPAPDFDEQLKSLVKSGKKAGYVGYQEVIDTFSGLNLDEEQFERIMDALNKNHIIMRIEQMDDDIPEDELAAIEDGEEIDLELESLEDNIPDSDNSDDPVRMYLKEIGRVSLLTAEEEINIAKRMEAGAKAKDTKEELEKELEQVKEEREAAKRRKKKVADFDVAIEEIKEKIKAAEETMEDGKDAEQELSQANLRLVVSIAKRYVGRGLLFLDLIQEGNLGLLKAVEKFDYRKGYKFSTYATWWIRQAITRAIADQARTIRIPVHMVETINKIIRINRQLLQELGREPSPAEIAARMDIQEDRVREILKISQDPVSLETPIGEEEDSHLGDFIQDENVPIPADATAQTLLREQLDEILDTLTERERKVLTLRFGLKDGRARTLEEVGKEFNVTRERIRQIEAKALRKLRHPSRSKRIRDFLD